MNTEPLVNIISSMKSDGVFNYAIAGVDSYLLNNGRVRLFECSRDHQDQITPHSHRFDFACLVLEGHVVNITWHEVDDNNGDFFEESVLTYNGTIGEHKVQKSGRSFYYPTRVKYTKGDTYSMDSDQIHSIQFSRGAKVLFFEGPAFKDTSLIIEPVVNGEKIPTYVKRDYMFIKSGE